MVHHLGTFGGSQCSNPAKHDPEGSGPTKCGVHSKEAAAKRDANSQARYTQENKQVAKNLARKLARQDVLKLAAELLVKLQEEAQVGEPLAVDLEPLCDKLRAALADAGPLS